MKPERKRVGVKYKVLRDKGWPLARIAKKYGVSVPAVSIGITRMVAPKKSRKKKSFSEELLSIVKAHKYNLNRLTETHRILRRSQQRHLRALKALKANDERLRR